MFMLQDKLIFVDATEMEEKREKHLLNHKSNGINKIINTLFHSLLSSKPDT